MDYHFLCEDFTLEYNASKNIDMSIKKYFDVNYNILDEIYFRPKNITKDKFKTIINDEEYRKILLDMILNLNDIDLKDVFESIVNELGDILNYKNINKKVYVIIGLNTTTIYSVKYKNEDVTVILLESTLGIEENIKMLLAHEYTHWVREKEIKHNIFELCIGERIITEGIACNFSEEVVPSKSKSYYSIVPDKTVYWVENNIDVIDNLIKNELDKKDMMYDFFYMYAKTKIPNMPVRTGYVYGYLKVKEYMKKNNLQVKDIIRIDWRKIINEI